MYHLEIQKEKKSLIVFLILLFVLFYFLMRPFFYSIILAAIIVALTYPLYKKILTSLKGYRRLTAFMMTLGLFFVLILPTIWIGMILVDQVVGLVGTLNLKETFSNLFSNEFYLEYIAPSLERFEQKFNVKIDFFGLINEFFKKVAYYLSDFSPQVLLRTAGFIFDFFIMIVTTYFLYLEGPRLFKILLDLSPLRRTHELRLSKQFTTIVSASVLGYLVTSLIQGVLAALAFAVTGINASVVLGTLVFFMAMVPVIGAAGVWIPVCVWLFLQGETGWGIFNLLYGTLIISGIDNILKPIIIQGRTQIHPLLIFFSLFGGIAFFGPLGILFGPVITGSLIATIKIYREEYLKV